MRRGFTILELLVASLLLAMLVTMLSMIFNQSSIAWRTGTAGVSELNEVREKLGVLHDVQDELLPGIGQQNAKTGSSDNRELQYRTVSLFKNWKGSGKLPNQPTDTGRAFEQVDWGKAGGFDISDAQTGKTKSLGGGKASAGNGAIIVGVRSAGPDKKFDTEDDITNWPEEVD